MACAPRTMAGLPRPRSTRLPARGGESGPSLWACLEARSCQGACSEGRSRSGSLRRLELSLPELTSFTPPQQARTQGRPRTCREVSRRLEALVLTAPQLHDLNLAALHDGAVAAPLHAKLAHGGWTRSGLGRGR